MGAKQRPEQSISSVLKLWAYGLVGGFRGRMWSGFAALVSGFPDGSGAVAGLIRCQWAGSTSRMGAKQRLEQSISSAWIVDSMAEYGQDLGLWWAVFLMDLERWPA